MLVDFHIHSTASDGTCSPAEIAEKTKGFAAAALTDHDTVDGVEEFLSAPVGPSLRFSGVELSIIPGEGYKQFHLLGLGFDIKNSLLHDFFAKIVNGRNERNFRILENLQRGGINVTEELVRKHLHGDIMGRPHIANAIVELGFANSVKDAFNNYLVPGTIGYAHRYRPSPNEAIDVIHAAGGVALMAHPTHWTRDITKLYNGLKELKNLGLDGIEAHYKANKTEETIDHLRIAKSLDFLVSAGSDFHGTNKVDIALGVDVNEDAISPLIKTIRP